MHSDLHDWVQRATSRPLPVLRQTVERVRRMMADGDDSVSALAEVIEKDIGLATQLVIRANGLRHAHLAHRLGSVEQAVLMLGLDRVRALSLELPVLEVKVSAERLPGVLAVIERAHHAAFQAYQFALYRSDTGANEVYLAALMHVLGDFALALYGDEEGQKIAAFTSYGVADEEAEYLVLGFAVEKLTQALARHWNLPALVGETAAPANAQQSRLYGIRLALRLARLAQHGWYSPEVLCCGEQIARYIGRSLDDTLALVHSTAAQAARRLDLGSAAARPAAALLLEPPSRRLVTPCGDEAAHCIVPQMTVLREIAGRLTASLDTGINLDALMELVLRGMHDGIGLNRVVFAALSPDRKTLNVRYVAGGDHDPAFDQFYLDLTERHLFASLMQGPKGVWVNAENEGEYWPQLPEAFQRLIKTRSFFVQSVFRGDRPVGLFYADRAGTECLLDVKAFKRFQVLAQLAGKIMERILRR